MGEEGWDLTENGFQEQIEGVGQRRAGILAILLLPLASKHPLALSKVKPIIVFALSIGVGVVVVGNGVQASTPVCWFCTASYPHHFLHTVKKFSRIWLPQVFILE